MESMKRYLLIPAVSMFALALAAPASAQFGRPSDRNGYYGSGLAYDNGYREGIKEGEKDGRSRDQFDFRDEGDWRDGDHGYRREYGPREQYRDLYRQAFRDGYDRGYREAFYR